MHKPLIASDPHAEDTCIVRDVDRNCWLEFARPRAIIEVYHPGDVREALARVEHNVLTQGLYAAGMIAYEAAPAFDPELSVRQDGRFPLLWFGLYNEPCPVEIPRFLDDSQTLAIDWQPTLGADEYARSFERIKAHLYEGDIYQVNYTYRLRAPFDQDPWPFFAHLSAAQGAAYGAFIRTRDWMILSASPELFFRLDGEHIVSRPMKGTAERGLTSEKDVLQARQLYASDKERAENLMIVDMVRNDMGRISVPGSVRVPRLFELEQYPTLWQMTSTVEAQTRACIPDIFEALFPAASITGAPKHRAMQIITGLESTPRGIYTGAIGFLAPGRRAQFNVAIRTITIDRKSNHAEYGVGGGIVWDSHCEREARECRTKARILSVRPKRFDLLETILWTPAEGYILLERHLERLAQTAAYFDYTIDEAAARERLYDLSHGLAPAAHRVRLLIASAGGITCQAQAINGSVPGAITTVALSTGPVDRHDPFLYHKTTNRQVYDEARRACPGYDDVILYNAQGEVTESTIANLVVDVGGDLVTPPLECGLLPGTCRGWMLEQRLIREQAVSIDQLLDSPRVFLINSVRGMYQVSVVCYRRSLV